MGEMSAFMRFREWLAYLIYPEIFRWYYERDGGVIRQAHNLLEEASLLLASCQTEALNKDIQRWMRRCGKFATQQEAQDE